MKKYLIALMAVGFLIAAGCTKNDSADRDLRQSLNRNVADLNTALNTISGSDAYRMLSSSNTPLKSEIDYRDSITLDMIAGIYDFAPNPYHYRNFFCPIMLFKKTGESDKLIVNIPQKLVFRPHYLYNLNLPDSQLKRDFTITANDYQYLYTWYYKYDYKLSAGFSLEDKDMGNLEVFSTKNSETAKSYSSTYNFNEGYSINVSFQSGDTTESSFSLSKEQDVLLKETILWFGEESHRKEWEYRLSIGNVEIRRGSGIDSIQVYLDGVLQKTAGVKIVDSTGSDGSICRHRDILLTFDDGTTVKLSELLDPIKEILITLYDSMHSMNFAKRVVDYIAIGIYYHERH
jgi:hypothetical protein